MKGLTKKVWITVIYTAAVLFASMISCGAVLPGEGETGNMSFTPAGLALTCSIEETGMDAWWPEGGQKRLRFSSDWSNFVTDRIADIMPGDVLLWKDDFDLRWVNHLAVVVEVDPEGEFYTTADGNQYTETGISFVTRWSLNKSNSSFGSVVVWRNKKSGEQIAAWAREMTQQIIDDVDTSYIDAWSNFGWCYCYTCTVLLNMPVTSETTGTTGMEGSAYEGIDSTDAEGLVQIRMNGTAGSLYIVRSRPANDHISDDNASSGNDPSDVTVYGYFITDETGKGYAAWKSSLPEGLYSVRSGKYYYNTSWLIDFVEAEEDPLITQLSAVQDSYISKK